MYRAVWLQGQSFALPLAKRTFVLDWLEVMGGLYFSPARSHYA
jgi:hypothetical protein